MYPTIYTGTVWVDGSVQEGGRLPRFPSETCESRPRRRSLRANIEHRLIVARPVGRRSRGFSLLDLLVSIAVISILIAILLPVLGHVSEATRRVVCRSNTRQFGIGLQLFAEDHNARLPASAYSGSFPAPQNMMIVRIDGGAWDGVGHLYEQDYLRAPEIFYCPSHHGNHSLDAYESAWNTVGDEIVGNYHFRSIPRSQAYLSELGPEVTLLADGMQSIDDYNHAVGANMLKADLSVHWFADPEGMLAQTLPQGIALGATGGPDIEAQQVAEAWYILDNGTDEGFNGELFPGAGPGGFGISGGRRR